MNLDFAPEDLAFRKEVRSFLAEQLPPRIASKVASGQRLTKADHEEWHGVLAARGWLAPTWPTEWGGPGWSPVRRYIFDVEMAQAHGPRIVPFGVGMLGPVFIRFGTEDQKRHLLPRILDGSDWWCQGFSEPGAGSDLASLNTRAVQEGEHYVVNGQKTWTTLGQYANKIFCLVRTSTAGRKQEGISFLLIDMDSPGVEVRPIITLDGEHEVNEVFFTDVRVPVENLVGEENRGWDCAKYLLAHERTNIAGVGHGMAALADLKALAAQRVSGGIPLLQDPLFAARLARVEIALENMKTTNLRVLAAAARGTAPLSETAMLKVCGTEIRQEIAALTRRALGRQALPFVPAGLDEDFDGDLPVPVSAMSVSSAYFNGRKISIYGGSNEVQREIIAKSMGL